MFSLNLWKLYTPYQCVAHIYNTYTVCCKILPTISPGFMQRLGGGGGGLLSGILQYILYIVLGMISGLLNTVDISLSVQCFS